MVHVFCSQTCLVKALAHSLVFLIKRVASYPGLPISFNVLKRVRQFVPYKQDIVHILVFVHVCVCVCVCVQYQWKTSKNSSCHSRECSIDCSRNVNSSPHSLTLLPRWKLGSCVYNSCCSVLEWTWEMGLTLQVTQQKRSYSPLSSHGERRN